MTKDEALKMALKAFEWNYNTDLDNIPACEKWAKMLKENIAAIKEALAQPEQLISDQINYGMSVTQGGKRIDPMSIYKEPKQEPVTWRYKIVDVFGRPVWTLKTPRSDTRVLESQPLYTTPPQRNPLTRKEVLAIIDKHPAEKKTGLPMFYRDQVLDIARAIEAAHGIKGEA